MMNMRQLKGFTLIELMIVVAVIGILAAIAYPSFQDSVRKSRRSDAMNELSSLQLHQTKWRANETTYASNADFTGDASYPNYPLVINYYTISVTANSATAFTATAVALAATDQNNDDALCKTMTINLDGPVVTDANKHCWKK